MISYTDGIQAVLVGWVAVAIGYIGAISKLFNSKNVFSIKKIVQLASIPCMIFYYTGNSKLNTWTYSPLLNSFLTLLSMSLITIIIYYIIPGKHNPIGLMHNLLATVFPETAPYGFALIEPLFGSKYLHLPSILILINCLICGPLFSLLLNYIHDVHPSDFDSDSSSNSNSEQNLSNSSNSSSLDNDGNPKHISRQIQDNQNRANNDIEETHDNEEMHDNEEINNQNNNANNANNNTNQENNENYENHENNENHILSNIQTNPEQKKAEKPFWNKVLWKFISPALVCFILGIIWSATGWEMLLFMTSFSNDLMRSIQASLFFCIGSYMYDQKFFGVKWYTLLIFIIVHAIILPLLSLLWGYLLNMDKTVCKACVLAHASPISLDAYHIMREAQLDYGAPSYAFLYTHLISPIVFFLWIVVFNTTKVLD